MGLLVGTDASHNRSGRAIAKLIGVLSEGNPYARDVRRSTCLGS